MQIVDLRDFILEDVYTYKLACDSPKSDENLKAFLGQFTDEYAKTIADYSDLLCSEDVRYFGEMIKNNRCALTIHYLPLEFLIANKTEVAKSIHNIALIEFENEERMDEVLKQYRTMCSTPALKVLDELTTDDNEQEEELD